jgi:hypothetical protein
MIPNFTTGVFNQQRWPGVGDTDDCWAIADLMAVHSVAPWIRLPNLPQYRELADNPNELGPTPGSITHSARAIRKLDPKLGDAIEVMRDGEFADFLGRLKAGHPASLSVKSGSLPPKLQFGFTGNHRVAVFWNGSEIRLANPLARAHSRSKVISEDALRTAIREHPDPGVNCVLLPTAAEAFQLHPLLTGAIEAAIAGLDDGADDTDATEDVTAT